MSIGLSAIIFVCALAGLVWALINSQAVLSIDLHKERASSEEESTQLDSMIKIGAKIEHGAKAFLNQEYSIMGAFILFFSFVVWFMVDNLGNESGRFSMYATVAYIIGSVTSMACGYIGMMIAVKANFRTTFKAINSLAEAFDTAFRAGCVMGFSMISLSLLILISLFEIYQSLYNPKNQKDFATMTEFLAAYGLGGSSIALFGRVGGGIYTKAADVGADLVGKVEEGLSEDSPRNPATIADNVGDNVGDIAGMGADLFGSFAEATCAALVFIASNPDLISYKNGKALYFPMLLSAFGVIACILSSAYGIFVYKVTTFELIEKALKLQLSISTGLILITVPIATVISLPTRWRVVQASHGPHGAVEEEYTTSFYATIAVCLGLVSGLIIGYSTDYYTSNAHEPVKEMAHACSSGPAINIIYGLALGYNSTIVPIIFLAITAIVSVALCGLFGVALAAIGMLTNLCVGLAIDAYGPISDNAGGITLFIRYC